MTFERAAGFDMPTTQFERVLIKHITDCYKEMDRLKAKNESALKAMDLHCSFFNEDGEAWCGFCNGLLTEAAEIEHENGKAEDQFRAVDFSHFEDCPLRVLTPMGALEAAGQLRLVNVEGQPDGI